MNTILTSTLFMPAQIQTIEETTSFTMITSVILIITILVFVFKGVAILESVNRINDNLSDSNKHFITKGVFIFLILCFLTPLARKLISNGLVFFILLIVTKILFGVHLSIKSREQGRNGIIWFILGFVEQTSALIALGLIPKLLKNKSPHFEDKKRLNDEFSEQIFELKKLKKDDLLTQGEFEQKKDNLKQKFQGKYLDLNRIENEKILLKKIDSLQKAFDNGLINVKEFQDKRKNLES